MKIEKTIRGWEIIPQDDDEHNCIDEFLCSLKRLHDLYNPKRISGRAVDSIALSIERNLSNP